MEEKIRKTADENAAAVPPRWKSVVKWVLIIAVVVVVALVIGPFVIGAVGAALGTGAVMTGIIAGAIVGAATSATIQVINNWASNQPLGQGVIKAALIGAIGGAVGGGFGAYFSSAAQAGTTVVNTAFRQFMANTAINVATETVMNVVTTGQFSWEALGMSVLSAVAVGGALHAAGGLKGVKGIQEGMMGAGEGFGGAIRTSLGGTVSINYRPTTTTSGQQGEESAGGAGGPTQQGEDVPGSGRPPQAEESAGGAGGPTQQGEDVPGSGRPPQGEESAGGGPVQNRDPAAQALEQAGLKPDYVDSIPPEQRGAVQEALDRWGTGANGKNQGVTHTLDYAEGAGGAGKANRLAKLSEYTGAGPFDPADPLLIPKVNETLDASVAAANSNAAQQVRIQGDKALYFVPKDNVAPGPSGFSNNQKGLIIIRFNGRYATFMNGTFKQFVRM
jgi:hypothetical protein